MNNKGYLISPTDLPRYKELIARYDSPQYQNQGNLMTAPTRLIKCGTLISGNIYNGTVQEFDGTNFHNVGTVLLNSVNGDALTEDDYYTGTKAGSVNGIPTYLTDFTSGNTFHGAYATGNTGTPSGGLANGGGTAYPDFSSIGYDTDGYISGGNVVIPAGLGGYYLVNFGSAFVSTSVGQLGCVAIASDVGDGFNQCVTVQNYFEISGWCQASIIANYLAGHQIALSVINQTPSGPEIYYESNVNLTRLGA